MRTADVVITVAAPWVAVLAGLGLPALTALVTKDLTGWVQVALLSVLSGAVGVISQGVGADWTFPLVHTVAQIGLVALVAFAAHYGYNLSGLSAQISLRTRAVGWRFHRHPRPCQEPASGHPLRQVDHSAMKLGRLPARVDPRTLRLERYLAPALPCPPPAVDWTTKIAAWPMMANDTVGDCTIAAAGHLIEEWTAWAASPYTPSNEAVIAAYSAVTGYDPTQTAPDGTNPTDRGADELAVLNYWRQTGIAGRRIAAYAAVQPSDTVTVRQAVDLFGGVYIGVALPLTARTQEIWDVPSGGPVGDGAPGSWGGHAVPVAAYSTGADGNLATLTCVTWGATKTMTAAFFAAYCEEAYAIVSPDFLAASGADPQGLQLAQLLADLAAIPQPAEQVSPAR